jgi:DNA-binding Xre family transcriptional regulator
MRHQYFASALQAFLEHHGLNQVELTRRTGIATSRINTYLGGQYRSVRPAHLEAICRAVPRQSPATANLIEAYLRDLIPLELARLLEFHFKHPNAARASDDVWVTPNGARPPPGLGKSFWCLLELCAAYPRVAQHTRLWIEIMRDTVSTDGARPPPAP